MALPLLGTIQSVDIQRIKLLRGLNEFGQGASLLHTLVICGKVNRLPVGVGSLHIRTHRVAVQGLLVVLSAEDATSKAGLVTGHSSLVAFSHPNALGLSLLKHSA